MLVVQNNNSGPDKDCTQAHEQSQIADWKGRYGGDLCKGVPDGSLPVGGDGYEEFLRKSECKAYKVGKACREKLLKSAAAKDKAAIQGVLIETTNRSRTIAANVMTSNLPNTLLMLLVPSLLLLCLCERTGKSIMVTQDRAIEIAKKEFAKYGRVVSDYDISVGPDDPPRTFWMICFDKKGPFRVPGGRHCVRVEKSGGAATFMQGE